MFELKPNSLVVTQKHGKDEQNPGNFGGMGKAKMTYLCNSVEQESEIKKSVRLVMQLNFDW